MNLENLKCFQAAAQTLNFRKGAARVFLSPAAFGERIRQLEDELRSPLFERTTREIRLTVAGSQLAVHVQRVFAEVDRCAEVVHSSQHLPYRISLGTRFELGISWLTPALGPLKKQVPARSLSLFFGDSEDLLRRLTDGLLDAVVSSVRLTQGKLDYARLHDEKYVFVGHRTTQFKRADDSAEFTLLDTQPDLPLFRYLLDATDADERWQFRDHEYLGGISAVRHRLLENAGVAVMPLYFVKEDLKHGRLKQLLPKTALKSDAFRLVWNRGDPRAALYEKLAGELRERPLQ